MADRDRIIPRHPLSWRSWRLRLVLALVTLVLVVRVVWGWQVGRMLRAQLDAARARGEPVAVEDVRFEAVPDAENAWAVQVRAMQAHVPGVFSPRSSNDEYREYPPYPAYWMKRAAASAQAHGQVFALARQARGLSRVQVRDRLTLPMGNSFFASLGDARNLANTLSDGALYSHVHGDDAEAIERILDELHLARSLRHEPFAVPQLVATGMDALALNTAQIIAPGLQTRAGVATRPASREQVRQLIAQVLDERMLWQGLEASIPMERLASMDFLQTRARDTWLIRPLGVMEAVRANRNIEIMIEAARLRNKPAVEAALSVRKFDDQYTESMFSQQRIPRYSRWFLEPGDLSRYYETQFRVVCERRATAVSLAAQLYRADHGGWPQRLEAMVPEYLPAVPVDPYHTDRRALGYEILKGVLPGGGDRPLVYYDPGEDCAALLRNEPMYQWQQWQPREIPGKRGRSVRQYRDLRRFEPLRPSTQAVDGNPDKPDAPGK